MLKLFLKNRSFYAFKIILCYKSLNWRIYLIYKVLSICLILLLIFKDTERVDLEPLCSHFLLVYVNLNVRINNHTMGLTAITSYGSEFWYILHSKRKQQLPFLKELWGKEGEDRTIWDGSRLVFCCGGWS